MIENRTSDREVTDMTDNTDTYRLDLPLDLNTIDDSGLPWAFLDAAADSSVVTPGRFVVVGSGAARAVAQVVDIEDGVVHVRPLRGSVASNSHLLTGQHLAS
jgi:hypothetical protein